MTPTGVTEEPTTERWSALGGVLLSALYLWVIVWLLLAVLLPSLGLGWKPVVITSGSMQPLIRPGDVVLAEQEEELVPGQVITYEDPAREGTLTTHRILSIGEDGAIRTQGDANRTPDSTLVPSDNVLGRGRLLVPLIGLPLVWLSGGAVLFGLWVVVTAISVAVVAGSGGNSGPPAPPSSSSSGRRALQRLVPLVRTVRPRTVQQAVVRFLVRQAKRLHDAVYRGYRPNPSRARRGAPGLALLALLIGLARTPATIALGVTALLVVLLFDPDGPQFRIGKWERLAVRTARVATAMVPTGLSSGGVFTIALVVAIAGSSVGRSAATFSAAADNSGSSFTAAAAFPTDDLLLYLQTNPDGADGVQQAYLPLTTDVPTATTLYNYDTDKDGDPGLKMKKAGVNQFENDNNKIQRWTHTPATDLTIASAQVVFHSAVKDFLQGEPSTVIWYLRHCATGSTDCVELAEATVTSADWQAGATGFVEKTTAFGNISHVVPAGRELELVVIQPSGGQDMWFAYDTVDQPARLVLTAPSSGTCPGAGSSVQHLTSDTRVEEDNPTQNFSTDNNLRVRSEAGKNKRTLLTVDLPVIPDGCTMTSATLRLTTSGSKLGRTILAQRTDSAFDTSTVTWLDQPTTSGALGSGPSTANGPTPIDVLGPVQELYTLGNTGLQLRDSAEGDPSTNYENTFRSLDDKPWPDPEGPRLEVTWGP